MATNEWLQTIVYKRLFTNGCLQAIYYKLLFTNDGLQTMVFKRWFTNDCLQTIVYKRLFTNEWLQGNDQPKVGIGPRVPITFGGSWSRIIRTGIAYSNNFTVWAARLGIHLIRLP